jgi:hypothetical protein
MSEAGQPNLQLVHLKHQTISLQLTACAVGLMGPKQWGDWSSSLKADIFERRSGGNPNITTAADGQFSKDGNVAANAARATILI